MRKLTIALILLCLILVACDTTTPTPIVVTATPIPVTDVPTLTPSATLNPLNPHEGAQPFTDIVSNANLVGGINETCFMHEGTCVIFNYPSGFDPLCYPFNLAETRYPCAWVYGRDTQNGTYSFETNLIAGYFGFTFDPVIVLYPSDNYLYLVRCDVRQGNPFFIDNAIGIKARFLSDEFPNGIYNFPRQDTGVDSHVWLFRVTQMRVVTFQCGIAIDWASFSNLNFTFSYMSIQIVASDYGTPVVIR